MKRVIVAMAVAAGLVITASASVAANGVAPPRSRAHGMSYAERAAA